MKNRQKHDNLCGWFQPLWFTCGPAPGRICFSLCDFSPIFCNYAGRLRMWYAVRGSCEIGNSDPQCPSLKLPHCLMGSNSSRQGFREIQHFFFEEDKTWDRERKRGVGGEKAFVKAPFCPPRHILTKYHSSWPHESRSHPPSLLQFTPNFILRSPPSFSNPSDGTTSIFEKESDCVL